MLEHKKLVKFHKVQYQIAEHNGKNGEKKLTLLAISEVQWVEKGLLEIEETTVIYSGLDEKRESNRRGVATGLRGVLKAAWKKEGTHTPWYRKEF